MENFLHISVSPHIHGKKSTRGFMLDVILALLPATIAGAVIFGAEALLVVAVCIATCLASFIGTLAMAFMANMPFALSAGMGLNAYLAYTVVLGQGISWQMALFAVFIEGLLFILMTVTNIREAIVNAIPVNLRYAIGGGIGFPVIIDVMKNKKLSKLNIHFPDG